MQAFRSETIGQAEKAEKEDKAQIGERDEAEYGDNFERDGIKVEYARVPPVAFGRHAEHGTQVTVHVVAERRAASLVDAFVHCIVKVIVDHVTCEKCN